MKRLLRVSILFLLFSCTETKVPNDMIPKQEMVGILIDLHLAEAVVSTKNPHPDSAKLKYSLLEKKVLEKHKISKEHYVESYTYYMTNIQLMDEIYVAVVDSLSLREARNILE